MNPYESLVADVHLWTLGDTLEALEDGYITVELLEMLYRQEGAYYRHGLDAAAVTIAGRRSHGPMSVRWEPFLGPEEEFIEASKDTETALGLAVLKLKPRLQYLTSSDPVEVERQLFLSYSLSTGNASVLAVAGWDIDLAESNGLNGAVADRLRSRDDHYAFWTAQRG